MLTPVLGVPKQALELIKTFEGFRTNAYVDPGSGGLPITIGYGSTKDTNGLPFHLGNTITPEAATALLERDAMDSVRCVAKGVQVALPEPCRAALVSFVYNLGPDNFQKSTLLKKLNAGDFKGASAEFPKWNLSSGRVMSGLVARRAAERKVFDQGIPS